MTDIPDDLDYTSEHEWLSRVDDIATIGITAVATGQLGDIVFLELPQVGAAVTAGQVCGEVESTKSVSDLYSPVTGVVAEVNGVAVTDPALVNSDPYGAGWLFRVTVESSGPLLTAEQYRAENESS